MTLQKQIIEILLKRDRPFYIFTEDTHPMFQSEPFLVEPSNQTDYDTKLIATPNKEYRPSARLVSLEDSYDPALIKKTRFESEEEKEAEIDRILKASGFTNSMSNRKSKGEEVERYFKLIEEKRQEELDFKRNGPKIHFILLDDVKQIRIAYEKELVLVWSFYADRDRESLTSLSDLSNVDDEMLIERYQMANPATLEDSIRNSIVKRGKEKFLTDLIPSYPEKHKEIIEKFLKEQDAYSFLKSIDDLMEAEKGRKVKTAFNILGSKFYHEFNGQYRKAELMNAITSSSGRFPRIEGGPVYRSRSWASAMANTGRTIDVDNRLVFRQPIEKIEEIIKPMMVEHYHKARGNYKKEINSYAFYDFCGNKTTYPLEELGLCKEEADE
ncbi:hypothetical protein [Sulfurovum sp.]|uniref:hypothetical protein n=1 Tax=Sulfurovum sp. TaxID=1969726 RepID=UPI00356623DF